MFHYKIQQSASLSLLQVIDATTLGCTLYIYAQMNFYIQKFSWAMQIIMPMTVFILLSLKTLQQNPFGQLLFRTQQQWISHYGKSISSAQFAYHTATSTLPAHDQRPHLYSQCCLVAIFKVDHSRFVL